MHLIRYLVISVFAICLTLAVLIFSGLYPVGADVPHNKLTHWLLETLRERSIARASKDIEVPPLDGYELLLTGGPDYNEMCATCHLQPGRTKSDMSVGLYPAPPNLASRPDEYGHVVGEEDREIISQRQFWIIKHGIKASGMPAWGPTHDDQRIWAMVAFLQKLPELDAVKYQILTARPDEDDGHAH